MTVSKSSGADTTLSGRRGFFRLTLTQVMFAALVASYGTLAAIAGRFLFPARRDDSTWQFVTTVDGLSVGESLSYMAPSGAKVVVVRQGAGEAADNFLALSSVCPHLGCQVHWEAHRDRFFCPCHNGAFDAQGKATEGPPAKAGQSLTRFPIRVDQGRVYLLAPRANVTNRT